MTHTEALQVRGCPSRSAELDEAYRRTAGRLAANTAVELESGKLKVSTLDRLDEPQSLVSFRECVGELLPTIDLPDLLAGHCCVGGGRLCRR